MGRIAFVFSGQGDQRPGMGLEMSRRVPEAAEVFARCDALRPNTSDQCFSGSDEELRETANAQPCLFAMELALAEALKARGLRADMAAGFSLGELSALTYAGATDLETGFRLVCARGRLMQRDAEKYPTAMAAVLKLSDERVAELCAGREGFYPVNYNCPGQVSVSGPEEGMPAFCEDVKRAGGRAMPLKVVGGFHSRYMAEAGAAFSRELAKVSLAEPRIPVYADVTGEPYPAQVAPLLEKQICSPVRWERAVRNMIAAGATVFVEIGPGKTLCNLIARVDKNARALPAGQYEDLDALVAEARSC